MKRLFPLDDLTKDYLYEDNFFSDKTSTFGFRTTHCSSLVPSQGIQLCRINYSRASSTSYNFRKGSTCPRLFRNDATLEPDYISAAFGETNNNHTKFNIIMENFLL